MGSRTPLPNSVEGKAGNPTQLQDAMQQAKRWVESVTDRFHSESPELRNCINATGEIFSSRFLATPLSSESIRAQVLIQEGFIQGEVQHDHEAILKELTGCEDGKLWSAHSLKPFACWLNSRNPNRVG